MPGAASEEEKLREMDQANKWEILVKVAFAYFLFYLPPFKLLTDCELLRAPPPSTIITRRPKRAWKVDANSILQLF